MLAVVVLLEEALSGKREELQKSISGVAQLYPKGSNLKRNISFESGTHIKSDELSDNYFISKSADDVSSVLEILNRPLVFLRRLTR